MCMAYRNWIIKLTRCNQPLLNGWAKLFQLERVVMVNSGHLMMMLVMSEKTQSGWLYWSSALREGSLLIKTGRMARTVVAHCNKGTRPRFVLNSLQRNREKFAECSDLLLFELSVTSFLAYTKECSTLGNVFICLAAVIFSSPQDVQHLTGSYDEFDTWQVLWGRLLCSVLCRLKSAIDLLFDISCLFAKLSNGRMLFMLRWFYICWW